MGGGGEHMLDEVAFLCIGADDALAAATLFAVGVDGHTLDVAGVADGNDDLLVGDEVFKVEGLGLFCGYFGAPGVARWFDKLLLPVGHYRISKV